MARMPDGKACSTVCESERYPDCQGSPAHPGIDNTEIMCKQEAKLSPEKPRVPSSPLPAITTTTRNVHKTSWAETETRRMSPRPKRSKFCPRRDRVRRCSFQDAGRDLEALRVSGASRSRPASRKLQRLISVLSRELQRLAETFSVTYGKTHWQRKNYTD